MILKILVKLFNLIYNFLKNYVLIFVGLFMFTTFIYFKFLRTRLPKDIPFNLSVIGFIILLEICIIYAYIVFRYIRPPKKPNENLKVIFNFLFEPLEALDNSIKNLKLIKLFVQKIVFWVATKVLYFFKTPLFEICFYIIPRVILIVIFIIDIFYFSKLHYIYYVLVPMGIILFLQRYFIFSVNKFKTELIHTFILYVEHINTRYEYGIHPSEWPENFDPDEEDDDDDIPSTMDLDVEIFINYYCKKVINEEEPPLINFLWLTKLFYEKNKDDNSRNLHRVLLHNNLKELLHIAILTTHINKISNMNTQLKIFKQIIYSLYFICWLYILVISIHTLNINDFFIFINSIWEEIPDPFSEISISSISIYTTKHEKQKHI